MRWARTGYNLSTYRSLQRDKNPFEGFFYFYRINRNGGIEPKPFSIGFRIEHPQSVIDDARFGKEAGNAILGAADYKLVHHCKDGRSVYSFCMCPGGTVVAATSEEGRVVTNGMSQYSRNERNYCGFRWCLRQDLSKEEFKH